MTADPLVSVILTTRDRPELLALALRFYQEQTYANRELIVVDDGDRFPADPQSIEAVGGRLVRVQPGTPLGTKLNMGTELASGTWCQKMDDDDWYAPEFLSTMIGAVRDSWQETCHPTIAFISPFLFFELASWEIRRSTDRNMPGATLLFARENWQAAPFRNVKRDEDVWFCIDQVEQGAKPLLVNKPELFLAVRHTASSRNRPHTWTHHGSRTLEEDLRERPLHRRRPEQLIPDWAVSVYKSLA